VLTNPKYIGANIYNRRSFKLKHKRINNPVQMWIWRDVAFAPIVDAAIFEMLKAFVDLHLRARYIFPIWCSGRRCKSVATA
jgi:hypothetical protein